MSSLFGTSNTASKLDKPATKNDILVPSPPGDTVSSLRFRPVIQGSNSFLCSSSWDNALQIWEVITQGDGQIQPKAKQVLQAPLLDACWSDDGTKVFAAGGDNKGWMWDITSNQVTQFAQHDAPISTVHFIDSPNYKCVMTGSWDKKLRFWDLRSPTPSLEFTLPDRIYCADVKYPLAVVAAANTHIYLYKLTESPSQFSDVESTLKFQSRCISIFMNKQKTEPSGFALGSIEGRVAINHIHPNMKENSFSFKCHRKTPDAVQNVQDIYPVNDIAFHPIHGTIATVGGDGRYIFWDKDIQTRLCFSDPFHLPITACTIEAQGHIFAYALGYDWSKGHEYNDPQKKPLIYLRPCYDDMNPANHKK